MLISGAPGPGTYELNQGWLFGGVYTSGSPDPDYDDGGTDATRLTFRADDAYGSQWPHVTGDVTLSLTGPGQLDGDNPFPLGDLRRRRRRPH